MESTRSARSVLPADIRTRSMATGAAYFIVSAAIYVATLVLASTARRWPILFAFALLNGVAISMLFIVGHDACHGSLTPNSTVNRWIARISFAPSLHPLASWEYSHNGLHHGWTNLRGKDPGYCPKSLAEFRALSSAAKLTERVFRSWIGLAAFYLVTVWWPIEFWPTGEHRQRINKRGTFSFDRRFVVLFCMAEVVALFVLHRGPSSAGAGLLHVVGRAAVLTALPFLTFAWLMAFATFQHHTHPRVVWYADEAEWSFYKSQVEGTVHLVFPRWIELLLHNIMEHTAHHVDTRVPLYNLNHAQRAIEQAYGDERVITERFSVASLNKVFRTCRLYDFENHCWLDFDGRPTTPARNLRDELESSAAEASQPQEKGGYA